jgi:hypothetical protein
MVKNFMTAKEDLRKHILDNWVSTCALLMERIQYLSSPFALLFDLKHQVKKGREHLEVYSKFLLKRQDR